MLMDLQEQTRMEDTYDKLNKIVDEINDISVSPSLVWVWCWDVIRDMHKNYHDLVDDEFYIGMPLDDIFKLLWRDADEQGFGLEYGVDHLYEHIRDWMIDADILVRKDGE